MQQLPVLTPAELEAYHAWIACTMALSPAVRKACLADLRAVLAASNQAPAALPVPVCTMRVVHIKED